VSTGIAVFAHGSRIESANEAVRAVAARLAHEGPYDRVEAAFLELGVPDLEGAVVRLEGRGVTHIIVIPYFLTLGTHLERDLPAIVGRIREQHPHIDIVTTPPLDGHPALLDVLMDRAKGL